MNEKDKDFLKSLEEIMGLEDFQNALNSINNALAKSGNKRAQIINLKDEITKTEMDIFNKTLMNYDLDNDSKEIDTLLRFYTQIRDLFKDLKEGLEGK